MKTRKQILLEGENEWTEFKSSFQSEVIETLVAFANTRGGTVYVGAVASAFVAVFDVTFITISQTKRISN